MAMVLDAFVGYVADMLMQVAADEMAVLLGITGKIRSLEEKLQSIKDYLADAERKRITDGSVQGWVTKLKGIMYEATNILDLCQLKAMDRQGAASTPCCNSLPFCLRNPVFTHRIGSRIKKLNKRLDEICKLGNAFSFIKLDTYQEYRTARLSAADRKTDPVLEHLAVVGEKIEEDTRALVEQLTKNNDDTMVVAIVGVGGIGKTTLAKKVFSNEDIQHKFDKRIWLSITQDFSEVELLKSAIIAVKGDLPGTHDKSLLVPALSDAVKDQKFLLVLDDMWGDRAWNCLLKAPFSYCAPGSRIVITTRNEMVARAMIAIHPYHRVDKLGPDDAWTLLRKQVVSGEADGPDIDMLEEIGKKIAEKCSGLPLAVKVMGGLLRQKDKQRRDWEMVLNDSIWSVAGMPEELNYAVYLSYEDLPPRVKQCFLYYSLLPKTAMLYRDEIISMWISEGFLHGTSDDLEEIGMKYHKELILRNLIEPDMQYIDQHVCNMHDVVRSFAQFVAKDEALAAHGGETCVISKLNAQKFLRLSIESKVSESDGLEGKVWESYGLDWSSLQAQKTLRTLISVGHINMKPGDLLGHFPFLRTLHMDSANVAILVDSLHKLKHLRYLCIEKSDISSLPDDIGKMKFLQHISLRGCQQFVNLPHSIVKLGQLRYLNVKETSINGIPRGFCDLTNLRKLHGFPAQVDGDWCSLEELGPLSQLRALGLERLENVSTTLSSAKARLSEKLHLNMLFLTCSSRLGDDGLIKEEGVTEEEQRRIEEVFDKLCPPACLENLNINGYFGENLPRWMMSISTSPLQSLRILFLTNLACCTQLPDGLSQLLCLDFIQIRRAPSIKRVGPEFVQPYSHHYPHSSVAAFPRLHKMELMEMVEWEEWEWEEQVQAMPVLEVLLLDNCKLGHFPPGLAANARSLKKLDVQYVKNLSYLKHFVFVTELKVTENPNLERIINLPNLHKLEIITCPKLKVLEGVRALQRLVLEDYNMETLPEYMRGVKPRHVELRCCLVLLISIAAGQSGPEGRKFSHFEHLKVYAHDGDNLRKWYVLYTRDPYNLETNVRCSFMSGGTLSFFKDAQRFESLFEMRRRTFSYVCSLVEVPFLQDMNCYTFVDGRVLSLEDRVAVALLMLKSGESPETVGSSVGVNKSTISLATESFVEAMHKRANHHLCLPDSSQKEKIKCKFDKIYGLPNCCGVVHTAHITLGSQNCDHEEEDGMLMQALVDPDMRFGNIKLGPSDTMNQLRLLRDSQLFKECEKGQELNGSKLKVSSDGSEVGEYVIGDRGYPLLPWLVTPYQLEKGGLTNFPYQAEFNRRHSAARTIALEALTRLKDKYKCLHGGILLLKNPTNAIYVCCMLHNIVIDMEEGAGMPSDQEVNYSQQVRQLGDEDAVRARDILSQHLLTSMSSQSGGVLEVN